MTASARRASSFQLKSRSEVLLAYRPPEQLPVDSSHDDREATASAEQEPLTMNPSEIRVIRRLSNRINILPIIARADILTDEKLNAVKAAVRRDLAEAKLGFGVFGPAKVDEPAMPNANDPASHPSSGEAEKGSTENGSVNGSANGSANGSGQHTDEGFGSGESSEDEQRRSRPRVVKLNPTRRLSTRSTSRSRLDLSEMEDRREPLSPDATDPDSLASVRFSAHFFAKQHPLSEIMPFAVIMPEQTNRVRRALKAPPTRPVSAYSTESSAVLQSPVSANGAPSEVFSSEENGRGTPTPTPTLRSPSTDHLPYLQGPPRDLKGVFVRRFRWGTVDVLDPMHCDFAALRTAILSTHLKVRWMFFWYTNLLI